MSTRKEKERGGYGEEGKLHVELKFDKEPVVFWLACEFACVMNCSEFC